MAASSADETTVIRAAQAADADNLSALAFAAKAHWGYDDRYMAACRDELEVSVAQIESLPFFVSEGPDGITGFYGLKLTDSYLELEYLFVRPDHIGSGTGRRLFDHMLRTAAQFDRPGVAIRSDPNAVAFYEHMGAEHIGRIPTKNPFEPSLPLLYVPL